MGTFMTMLRPVGALRCFIRLLNGDCVVHCQLNFLPIVAFSFFSGVGQIEIDLAFPFPFPFLTHTHINTNTTDG